MKLPPPIPLERRLPKSTVPQRSGIQGSIQRLLLFLTCLWLLVSVVLPLMEVVKRATRMELPITVEEPADTEKARDEFRGQISAAGYTILLMSEKGRGRLYINNQPMNSNSPVVLEDLEVWFSDEALLKTVITRMAQDVPGRESQPVAPIVLERITRQKAPAQWTIDGRPVPAGETVHVVTRFIGAANFIHYFNIPSLARSAWNSLAVGVTTTLISVFLAFVYAYGLNRTCIPAKTLFRVIAMLPLFAPTMLYGLSLVYLFGNQGIITTGFFNALPWLALDINLYGFTGIVLAETAFTFPAAMMILSVSLTHTDARLYEASASLGAGPVRTFFSVTLPGIKYGLLSAVFVCFTLSYTDFGGPKVVGGQFNVLAVDIYKQVVGQQNFGMGATISLVLLAPTLVAFIADRMIQRRSHAALTARSIPLIPSPVMGRDTVFMIFCSLIALMILAMLFTAGIASFVKIWPYAFSHPDLYPDRWTLFHYSFRGVGGGGYDAFRNSMRMAAYTALFGTIITFVSAYLIEKTKGADRLRQGAYLLSIIPLALPGLVIGIAYVFFFNKPFFAIPFTGVQAVNPFQFIYGTLAILVLSNIIHFYTVAFLTATTALRQLDKEFEVVSESMGVPFYRTFFKVTVPICFPAILEIAAYYFVSATATVSAVIFLYSSRLPLASVAVVNMDDAGDTAAAAAMCMLIVLANIFVRSLAEGAGRMFTRKTQVWRHP